MILVFILSSSLPLFGLLLMSHCESSFLALTEVVRKILGEVTRKSDRPTNRPRVKTTTAQGLQAFVSECHTYEAASLQSARRMLIALDRRKSLHENRDACIQSALSPV
jgi:hypothetical protein